MKRILFAWIFVLLLSTGSFAMERFEIITTEELKNMIDDRASGKIDFILVNALDEIIFRSSSIPGSVSVPWSRVKETINRLGNDKDKLIVTY